MARSRTSKANPVTMNKTEGFKYKAKNQPFFNQTRGFGLRPEFIEGTLQ